MAIFNSIEVARSFAQSFEKGKNSEQRVAYCGVSLQGVRRSLETGIVPTILIKSVVEASSAPPSIPLVPIKDRLNPSNISYREDQAAYDIAAEQARKLARAHFLLASLGLDITVDDYRRIALILTSKIEGFRNTTYEAALSEATRVAVKRRRDVLDIMEETKKIEGGVVLAIAQSLFDAPVKLRNYQNSYLIGLVTNQGLNYQHICGAEPLGDEEYAFFDDLSLPFSKK